MRVIKIDNENLLKGIETLKNHYEIPDSVNLYIEKGEKLTVKWQGDDVYITYPINSALFRALSLISLNFKKGERNNIEETLYFDECGVMLDMSRNGVMKVEAVKKYADMMALMGLNQLYLYLEDTYIILYGRKMSRIQSMVGLGRMSPAAVRAILVSSGPTSS